jgi:carbamoyl-phosphate synthase large subunit
VAERIGFPVMVRPSYVLGGRAMEVVYDADSLLGYMRRTAVGTARRAVLIDQFLADATEVDVDAVGDGERVIVAGVMEHIEEAGVHSGDSACSLPPFSLARPIVEEIARQTRALGAELNVVGLMNVQFAVKAGEVYILEVNPRGSRTVPFVSKATGVPWAKVAMRCMLGQGLQAQGIAEPDPFAMTHVAVKEAVFPFNKFPGVDTILGPEMVSTGEVMGIDTDFGLAFAKAQAGAWTALPAAGKAFLSVRDADKAAVVAIAKELHVLGFEVLATDGTCRAIAAAGVPAVRVNKVREGRPHIVDMVKNGEVTLCVNTVGDAQGQADSFSLRREAVARKMSYFTTVAGGKAGVRAIGAMRGKGMTIRALQDYFDGKRGREA